MGTDCAPFLANLYLYALEYNYLEKLTKTNITEARKFNFTSRYIDDVFLLNNDCVFENNRHNIYPECLVTNKENETDDKCTFLDINMKIENDKLITFLYDKRNDFSFKQEVFLF